LASITSSPSTTILSSSPLITDFTACPSHGLDANGDDCRLPYSPYYNLDLYNPWNTTQNPTNILPPNPSLASYCSSVFVDALDSWMATAAVYYYGNTYVAETTNRMGDISSYTTSTTTWARFQDELFFTPKAPCCLNCTLYGGTVQVYYWHTPAPSPPVTALVDSSNFTLRVATCFMLSPAADLYFSFLAFHLRFTLPFSLSMLMISVEMLDHPIMQPPLPSTPENCQQLWDGRMTL
jgi:hypothetical protein